MKTFIVLFADGTMQFFNRRPEKECFLSGSKLFEADGKSLISMIPMWSELGFNFESYFKPIAWK